MTTIARRPPAAGRHRRYSAVIQPRPTDAEKYLYASRSLLYLAVSLTIAFAAGFVSQVLFEIHSGFWFFGIFTLIGTVAFSMSMPLGFAGRGFSIDRHRARVRAWRPARYPSVDIFLPVCGEPVEVLSNTWIAVAALARAYPGVVRPFVLDDAADPVARERAAVLGLGYVVRPDRGALK